MFCLQVDFNFLQQRVETIKDAVAWAEIILNTGGADMVTIWFQESIKNQSSVIVKTLWK